MPQAVEQGVCQECGKSEANYTVENRTLSDEGVTYQLSCQCGTPAAVRIQDDGLAASDNISHEDASWNSDE